MKQTELQELLSEHTVDGELNIDALNKAINAKFDPVIEAKVAKAKGSGKQDHINEFLTEQGYENVDQFTAFVKNSKAGASELTEKVSRYESELQALTAERDSLKSQTEEYGYMSKLGKVDDRFKKFVMSEVKGLTNDDTDFDTALETYLTDNAHYLAEQAPIVTKTPKSGNKLDHGSNSEIARLEEKYNIKLE